ncbi:hypothetical protein J1N35_007378 [Gossypium stocksii]|uniref:Uncharacterized protein n=1 Tax=Gossypium stocksii TaxID=47602 RepID=A0A9D4AFJ3_9ROSI|nr:hypothetical protein J1N35_007378 [Gossypium stocksii]
MEEQLRDFVLDSLGTNTKKMNELVNSTAKKLAKKDENLEDMVLAMKKEIEELKRELMIYKATLSNGMLSSRPKQQAMDVSKLEKFKGARSTRDVGNFLWEMDELMLQISDLNEKRTFYWFVDGLNPWEKHELLRQGIIELTVAMSKIKSFVELGLMNDKFESSKPNGKSNGERNHEKMKRGIVMMATVLIT